LKTITHLEFEKILSENPGLILLDVRTPAEFDDGYIEGSVNIPLDQLTPAYFQENNKRFSEDSLYIICHRGPRAQYAAKLFEKEGICNTVVVDGGVSAWIDEGFEVKKLKG